jgi:hypothetical protein
MWYYSKTLFATFFISGSQILNSVSELSRGLVKHRLCRVRVSDSDSVVLVKLSLTSY